MCSMQIQCLISMQAILKYVPFRWGILLNHDLSGMDPETNSFGDENGGDYNRRILTIGTNTPTTRNYLVGLSVTF